MDSYTSFDCDACVLAKVLLGKVLRVKYHKWWLSAQIIETEAYYLTEKGSHASLGFTAKRKALFMPAGTIYMYYARGGDSLNISCQGAGNAVLIKSGFALGNKTTISIMQRLNPINGRPRILTQLCGGQTLLCKSLNLKVLIWDQKSFDPSKFYIADTGYKPKHVIQTTRLGIPKGRDEHLPYRFIDYHYARFCTSNPLTKRQWHKGRDYFILQ